MIPWKERLYSFLLSRVLGPWLDEDSLQLLHQSIEVSLQHGKLVLKNVGLNTQHLTRKLNQLQKQRRWKICKATLERLDISLSLEETDHPTETTTSTSNEQPTFTTTPSSSSAQGTTLGRLAWKTALSFGSTGENGGQISLIAKVILDGLAICIEPDNSDNEEESQQEEEEKGRTNPPTFVEPKKEESSTKTLSSTARNLLSSYIDAALASLRLTVQIHRLNIQLKPSSNVATSHSEHAFQSTAPWLDLTIKSISYQDVEMISKTASLDSGSTSISSQFQSSSYTTVMHKALDFTRISLSVDGTCEPKSTTLVMLDGTTSIRMRAIEYRDTSPKNKKYPASASSKEKVPAPQIQQDLEVFLGNLHVFVDQDLLHRLYPIVEDMTESNKKSITEQRATTTSLQDRKSASSVDNHLREPLVVTKSDEQDLKAIEDIMKQYNEARLRAERNEVRGGLLLPNTDDSEITFDAFFDANDKSFYRYSTMLSKSQALIEEGRGDDFVHTKMKCHLSSASVKIAFSVQEYILATLSDIEASMSLSSLTSNHSLNVSYFEIEEAQSNSNEPHVNIENILSFVTTENDRNSRIHGHAAEEILVQAPCISIAVSTQMKRNNNASPFATEISSCSFVKEVEVDLDIDPFVLSCSKSALGNLSLFISDAMPKRNKKADGSQKDGTKRPDIDFRLRLRGYCAHVDVLFPMDVPMEAWMPLFSRSGVSLPHGYDHIFNKSAIGFHFERLSLQSSDTPNDFCSKTAELDFQRMLGYAYLHSPLVENCQLFDFLAVAGESDPAHIRVSQFDPSKDGFGQENYATKTFPMAPAVSSFKARQEDDDDDRDGSPIYSTSKEFEIASRKELRGPDPQSKMLDAVSRANRMVDLHVANLSVDLSDVEMGILIEGFHSFINEAKSETAINESELDAEKQQDSDARSFCSSVSVAVDEICVRLHQTNDPVTISSRNFSHQIKLGKFRSNVLKDGNCVQHIRILAHDVAVHEIAKEAHAKETTADSSSHAEERAERLRCRLRLLPTTNFTPLFYRSHLFTPISRQSPALLIDLIYSSDEGGLSHKSVYLTLYDLTHRLDYESRWLKRIGRLAESISTRLRNDSEEKVLETTREPGAQKDSMTRLFLCLADCNVDYTSPCRWKTAARIILRLGEIRISSNMIHPSPTLQAIKLSVGDLAVCLCNSRFPYNFENSHMTHADASTNVLQEVPLTRTQKQDDIIRLMNFRTVAMLDSLDAIITLARTETRQPQQPKLHIGLCVGEISLFVAKDSFSVLTSSIGELCSEACALDDETFQKLKESSKSIQETYFDSQEESEPQTQDNLPRIKVLDDLQKRSALRPAVGTANSKNVESRYLLDGYDYVTIDQDESISSGIPSGDEQAARWYGSEKRDSESPKGLAETTTIHTCSSDDNMDALREKDTPKPFQIIAHHFPLQPPSDPLGDDDMGAASYAGIPSPHVKSRIVVSDLSLKMRLFDGYDWPECLHEELRKAQRAGSFLIDLDSQMLLLKKKAEEIKNEGLNQLSGDGTVDRKASLMAGLLETQQTDPKSSFQNLPLPQERGASIKAQAEHRRLARRTDKYVQFSVSGVSLRTDSMEASGDHLLASCLNLKVQDFFFAETISSNKPIKMAGEWFHEVDHPRDSKDGLFMMKMVTWNAENRVSPEDELVNDNCEAALKILPLRCFLDQKAIRFMRAFFMSDSLQVEDAKTQPGLPKGLYSVPPPLFRRFLAKPLKLKVNYKPEKLDQSALRNGQIVELLNISPLESLVLTLDQVVIEKVVGFGGVLSVLVPKWIQHITSTQLVKFLTNAKPFEPITTVSEGFSDMVVLPWEAVKHGSDVQKALRAGVSSFGRAVAYETLTLSSEVAELVASAGHQQRLLPPRPHEVPAGMRDTTEHVVESISRGLQTANTTIIIVPYREYQRNGTTGLVTSVIRGIPVAIAAPASGAAEALSYALIGMRNGLRPDIRREEEVSQRGLRFDG